MDIVRELDTAWLLKLTSFLFWSSLYLLSNLKLPNKSPEYHSRVVTLLHGTVATLVGLSQSQVLLRHYALMLWSWGYFAFDLLWCILYWNQGNLMLAHHFCTLVAISVYMQRNATGCSFACTIAFMEVTNPCLQIRWFLKKEGYSGTKIYYAAEAVYLVSFLILRGLVGTYILYKIMLTKDFGIDQKLIAVSLHTISLGLLWEIMSYVVYKYKNNLMSVIMDHIGTVHDQT